MIFIPAIDLVGGQCVRLSEGDFSRQTNYGLDPLAMAQKFESEGAQWLHLVDLDGARSGRPEQLAVAAQIREGVGMKLEWGGGIRSMESIREALRWVDRVVVGTRLVADLGFAREVFAEFGGQVAAGLDLRGGYPATHGWAETAEQSGLVLAEKLLELGCPRVIVTDIATDGMLSGPNLDLMRQFVDELKMPIVASGGVSNLTDLEDLNKTGVEGVIVGKAIYEGRFTVQEATNLLNLVSK